MRILFGTDHAGFELKETLVPFVRDELGYEVEDCGAHAYNPDDDYPGLIRNAIAKMEEEDMAIVLGGSGTGEAIVANKHAGVRAAVYYGGNTDIVKLSREHNNANVLSLGARFLSESEAKEAVQLWLSTQFSNEERHVRRINDIEV